MNKYKIILLLLLSLTFTCVQAQKRLLKRGDKQFFGYNYQKALYYYEGVKNKTSEVERIMAVCYEMTTQLDKALKMYENLTAKPDKTFDDTWNYFLLLQKLEKYDKAKELIPVLFEMKPSDSRVRNYKLAGNWYESIKNAESLYEVKNLKMNNKQQEFGTVYYKDKIIFASTRKHQNIIKRIWNGNRLHYLNMFVGQLGDNDELIKPKPYNRKLNRKYHDGPVCFNEGGTFMALTRNNYASKSLDGTRKLQILTSEYINNKWTVPESFPYNNAEFSIGHASLTPDGKYMYFASDMPGGKGGTDLYKVERRKDGTWGKLINLETLNTEGNEMFPYFHPKGYLFFSSNGHVGLGGLDIFWTTVTGDNYGAVANLGVPVNTPADDFAFLQDSAMQKGYFSSNRKEGKGSDDIYFAKAIKPLKKGKVIKGVSKDKQDSIVPFATVKLYLNDTVIADAISDSLGRYQFLVDKETLYKLTGDKEGYIGGNNTANTDVPQDTIYADLILDKIPEFALHILVTEKVSGKPIEGVKISLINKITGSEETLSTSANGDYGRALKDVSINDSLIYHLKYEKEGYFSVYANYNELIDKEGTYYIREQLVKYSDLKIGDDLGKYFTINMIFFDLDKYNIRPDAAIELDKIVNIMNQYPTMIIELGSHTDCRASYAYNIRLSQNRAKSSAAYIKERITKPDRIYGKGYGETQLVNECECEGKVVVPCTDEQHQMNRRTEFKIIKL